MSRDACAPSLSVVIGTTQGWPSIRPCLESLGAQATAPWVEIIVADGSDCVPPEGTPLGPGVVWLRHPGVSVLELRALASRAARGEIVAVTEDHCVVAPDWCARILEAHARHREAAAVKGAVTNGSRAHLIDWAAFLLNQAPHIPPFAGKGGDAVLGVSCVSYKRWALERLASSRAPWPELRDHRAWQAAGDRLVADERIWVEHYQSVGFIATSALQFHNARTVSGIRRDRMGWRDWTRLVAVAVLPFYRTLRTVSTCLGKRVPRVILLASVPLILWFYCCKGTGELAGYLAGTGESPRRVL